MAGYDSNFIPQQIPVKSDVEPDLDEGELWYDTANGSLKRKLSNGNFTSIGNSIDEDTIQKDSNGDIYALISENIQYLDSQASDWAITDNAGEYTWYIDDSIDGSGNGLMDANGYIYADKNVIIDDDEMDINYKFGESNGGKATFKVLIDGNTVYSKSGDTGNVTVTVDVSSYNDGNEHQLRARLDNGNEDWGIDLNVSDITINTKRVTYR